MSQFVEQLLNSKDYSEYSVKLGNIIEQENEYREILANPSKSPISECLTEKYCMLVPISTNYEKFKYRTLFKEEEGIPKVFPLKNRLSCDRKCISNLTEFKRNFEILTKGMFRYIDWSNIIIAGGSVSTCLKPVPEKYSQNRTTLNKYFHEKEYSGVDIDMFICGLNEADAKNKILHIADSIEGEIIFPVKYFRTSHAITIVSQHPYPNIQIILRLYKSPAEVIMGFDIDSCAVLYDGNDVYCLPRSYNAITSQYNTIDLTRRSPTYESRLAKYALRGYEVLVPSLIREKVDPIIYEKSFHEVVGLSRLLLLEKYGEPENRFRYIIEKTKLTGRGLTKMMRQVLSTANLRNEIIDIGERISDYSTVFFPTGPGWSAKKIAELLRVKDKLLNKSFYSGEERDYHTHPCFISDTIKGLFKSGCENCPNYPPNVSEEVKDRYVHGPIAFLQDNPGRQFIGSFHPITEGDWSEGTYYEGHVDDYFNLITKNNVEILDKFVKDNNLNYNIVDSLGRNGLHIVSFYNNVEIANYLLKNNVNLHHKMIDGRTIFHICSIYGYHELLSAILMYNSSLPETKRFNIKDTYDNGYYLTSLDYATLFLNVECVDLLIRHGCKPDSALSKKSDLAGMPTIMLAGFNGDKYPERCRKIVEIFLKYGVNSFTVYIHPSSYHTIFQYAVKHSMIEFVRAYLDLDPESIKQFDMLYEDQHLLYDVVRLGYIDMFKLLIDKGCDINVRRSQLDNYNMWLNKLPRKKGYYRYRTSLEDMNAPIEVMIENIISDKDAAIKYEMMEYAASKCKIDYILKYKGDLNIASTILNKNARNMKDIEKCKKEIDKHHTNQDLYTLSESIAKAMEFNRSNEYAKFINDTRNKLIEHKRAKLKERSTIEIMDESEYTNGFLKRTDTKNNEKRVRLLENQNVYLTKMLALVKKEANLEPEIPLDKKTRELGYRIRETEDKRSFDVMTYNNSSLSYVEVPETNLQTYFDFYEAIYQNNIDKINELTDIKRGKDIALVASRCPNHFNPITLSLYRGHFDLVQHLIDIAKLQYTPVLPEEKMEPHPINNLKLALGQIDERNNENIVTNYNIKSESYDNIITQVPVADILLATAELPIFVFNQTFINTKKIVQDMNDHYYNINSLYYALLINNGDLFETFIDCINFYDHHLFTTRYKHNKFANYEESYYHKISQINNYQIRWNYYNRGNYEEIKFRKTLIFEVIKLKNLNLFKILAKKFGLCYLLPSPKAKELFLNSVMWIVSSFGTPEMLDYLLSPSVVEDLTYFNSNHNIFKEEWNKYKLIDKIKKQFNINFGKEVKKEYDRKKQKFLETDYNSNQSSRTEEKYKHSMLYYAAYNKNIDNIKYIVENLDKSIGQKELDEALAASCVEGNQEIMKYLYDHGAKFNSKALIDFLSQLPICPNIRIINDNTEDYTTDCYCYNYNYFNDIRKNIDYNDEETNKVMYRYNYLLREFDTILSIINDNDRTDLFAHDEIKLMEKAFEKRSIELIDLLLKRQYSLNTFNKCYQTIAHVTALNYDWFVILTKYFSSILNNPEFQSLYNLEDGHGDSPFDVSINVFIKALLGAFSKRYYYYYDKINVLLAELNIPKDRKLTSNDIIKESTQNVDIKNFGNGWGKAPDRFSGRYDGYNSSDHIYLTMTKNYYYYDYSDSDDSDNDYDSDGGKKKKNIYDNKDEEDEHGVKRYKSVWIV